MRSIALYGDKVFSPTTDAMLVCAGCAQNGKVVWSTSLSDAAKGHSQHRRRDGHSWQGLDRPDRLQRYAGETLLHQRL